MKSNAEPVTVYTPRQLQTRWQPLEEFLPLPGQAAPETVFQPLPPADLEAHELVPVESEPDED